MIQTRNLVLPVVRVHLPVTCTWVLVPGLSELWKRVVEPYIECHNEGKNGLWFTTEENLDQRCILLQNGEMTPVHLLAAAGPVTERAELAPGSRGHRPPPLVTHLWVLWPAAVQAFILQGCSAVLKVCEPLRLSLCDPLPKQGPGQSWEEPGYYTDRIKCQGSLIPCARWHQITRLAWVQEEFQQRDKITVKCLKAPVLFVKYWLSLEVSQNRKIICSRAVPSNTASAIHLGLFFALQYFFCISKIKGKTSFLQRGKSFWCLADAPITNPINMPRFCLFLQIPRQTNCFVVRNKRSHFFLSSLRYQYSRVWKSPHAL